MSRSKRAYKIYGPAHFRATWEKFLEIAHRDGQSASELIRVWVEGYVARKDPGNPQRPLTSWVEGHEDQEALEEKELLAWLSEYAEERGGKVLYRHIVEVLRGTGVPPVRRAAMAEDLARRLTKAGFSIVL